MVMFHTLDDYYNNHKDNEALASLLGDLDPNIFTDNMPADPAIYNDWLLISSKYLAKEEVAIEDYLTAISEFLKSYRDILDDSLNRAIDFFENSTEAYDIVKRNLAN